MSDLAVFLVCVTVVVSLGILRDMLVIHTAYKSSARRRLEKSACP